MDVATGVAYSLNNRTEVVGFHLPPGDSFPLNLGFRWTLEGGLEDVESLTGVTPPWSYFAPLSTTRFIRTDGVMAGERGGGAVLWQPDGQLSTFGPGIANSVNDLGVAAGATRVSDAYPVVWLARHGVAGRDDRRRVPGGFRILGRRLLADVDAKASRGVLREINLARKAIRPFHDKVAARHLRRAVKEVDDLARSGELALDWAASPQRIGRWIAERL